MGLAPSSSRSCTYLATRLPTASRCMRLWQFKGVFGWSALLFLHERSRIKPSKQRVRLVMWLHERMQIYGWIQAGGIRSIWASLASQTRWMQGWSVRPTCHSHRLDRLHPVIQKTKQHLGFLTAHATSPNAFLFEIRFHPTCVRSCRIYDVTLRQPNTP